MLIFVKKDGEMKMQNYVWIIPILIILLYEYKIKKENNIQTRILMKRKKRGNSEMTQLINNYIGKDCIIYTMNSQITGTIRGINEGWISVEIADGNTDIVNSEYVMRIREYPRNKKGKKKAIVSD